MDHTDNLNLNLPEDDDPADIRYLNENFMTIDEKLAALLPVVTTADNGKFLVVVEGVWAATAIAQASGGTY